MGTINWELITEESSALASFESGEYVYSDMCPDEEKPRMEGNGLVYTDGNNNYCVMFNLGDKGNEVLKDEKVRKALSLAIDRDRIINIRGLNDEEGVTLICRGYTNEEGTDFVDYCDPWEDLSAYDANCEEAKQLLAEAGYENGAGFPALTYITNTDHGKRLQKPLSTTGKKCLVLIHYRRKSRKLLSRRSEIMTRLLWMDFMDYKDLSNMYGTFVNTAEANSFYQSDAYDGNTQKRSAQTMRQNQWEAYKECDSILSKKIFRYL